MFGLVRISISTITYLSMTMLVFVLFYLFTVYGVHSELIIDIKVFSFSRSHFEYYTNNINCISMTNNLILSFTKKKKKKKQKRKLKEEEK